MARDLTKYLHGEMDKEAGIEHISHRTKIVATVGPACDTYEKLLALVSGSSCLKVNRRAVVRRRESIGIL